MGQVVSDLSGDEEIDGTQDRKHRDVFFRQQLEIIISIKTTTSEVADEKGTVQGTSQRKNENRRGVYVV